MVLSFTLTSFGLGDMRAIIHLEEELFPEDTYGMAEFLSLYLRGRETFLVARAGGAVVGYIAAYAEGEAGYIASVAVAAAYQRQGLGRALVAAVLARFAAAGARAVGLHVRADNQPAIHLYQSLGFVPRDRLVAYYQDGMTALYMERPASILS